MLNLRNLPGARFLYQILQNTYDALRRQFRRDSLVIEESTDAPADVTVKQKKRQPRRPSETHLWVRMFERLDTIMEIESKARMRETGRSVCGHSDFRRRHGSFVYFGAMNDFPTVVTHQHVFDLPGLFSLATGSHIDLARDKTLSPHMTLIKITGIKLDKAPRTIEPCSGAVYEASFLYGALPRQKRWGKTTKALSEAGYCFVCVEPNGKTRLLKELGKPPSIAYFYAMACKTTLPEIMENLATDFAQAINAYRVRDSNWLVKVINTKRRVRATFGIRPLDAPKVFNERMKVRTASGRTKPIFHPVRAHERALGDGLKTVVKLHHRGATKFHWRGYDCEIAIPSWSGTRLKGRATIPANDFTLSSLVDPKHIPEQERLSTETISDELFWPDEPTEHPSKVSGGRTA